MKSHSVYFFLVWLASVNSVLWRFSHVAVYSWPSVSVGFTSADRKGQPYCAILRKKLEHLWILVSEGALEPFPCGYRGTSVSVVDSLLLLSGYLSYGCTQIYLFTWWGISELFLALLISNCMYQSLFLILWSLCSDLSTKEAESLGPDHCLHVGAGRIPKLLTMQSH